MLQAVSRQFIKGSAKVLGAAENSRFVQGTQKWFLKDPGSNLATITVTSMIIKDAVGCWKYVTQSKNNKAIPEDKRKFVTALDLTNGLLMILAQAGMFMAVRKYSGPIFNKLFKNSFGEKALKNAGVQLRNTCKAENIKIPRKIDIAKDFIKEKNNMQNIFKFLLETASATIIGKRIIVPLIATPLAQKVEKRMEAKELEKNGGVKKVEVANEEEKETKALPEVGNKLDVVSNETGSTNLLDKYRKQATVA